MVKSVHRASNPLEKRQSLVDREWPKLESTGQRAALKSGHCNVRAPSWKHPGSQNLYQTSMLYAPHPLGFIEKPSNLVLVDLLLWMKHLERKLALPIRGGVDNRAATLSENADTLELA